jgi:hypothetical protein
MRPAAPQGIHVSDKQKLSIGNCRMYGLRLFQLLAAQFQVFASWTRKFFSGHAASKAE